MSVTTQSPTHEIVEELKARASDALHPGHSAEGEASTHALQSELGDRSSDVLHPGHQAARVAAWDWEENYVESPEFQGEPDVQIHYDNGYEVDVLADDDHPMAFNWYLIDDNGYQKGQGAGEFATPAMAQADAERKAPQLWRQIQGSRRTASEPSEENIIESFVDWSGGFGPDEVDPDEIDTYVSAAMPAGWDEAHVRSVLSKESSKMATKSLDRKRAAMDRKEVLDHLVNQHGLTNDEDAEADDDDLSGIADDPDEMNRLHDELHSYGDAEHEHNASRKRAAASWEFFGDGDGEYNGVGDDPGPTAQVTQDEHGGSETWSAYVFADPDTDEYKEKGGFQTRDQAVAWANTMIGVLGGNLASKSATSHRPTNRSQGVGGTMSNVSTTSRPKVAGRRCADCGYEDLLARFASGSCPECRSEQLVRISADVPEAFKEQWGKGGDSSSDSDGDSDDSGGDGDGDSDDSGGGGGDKMPEDVKEHFEGKDSKRRNPALARARRRAAQRRRQAEFGDETTQTTNPPGSGPSIEEVRKPDLGVTDVENLDNGGVAESDLVNEDSTDVENLDATDVDIARTEPTDDVEKPSQDTDKQLDKADWVHDVDDGAETGVTPQDDQDTHPSNLISPDYDKAASQDRAARLLEVLSFVEDREQIGLSTRQQRMAEVARFERMDPRELKGWVDATNSFKVAMRQAQSQRRPVAPARSAGRMPDLGRQSQIDGNDVLGDELAFLS